MYSPNGISGKGIAAIVARNPHFLNRVQLIGYVGRQPLLRRRRDGRGLSAHFHVVTHEFSIFDSVARRLRQVVQWHHVSVWPQVLVDRIKPLQGGERVYIEGSLRTVAWGASFRGEASHEKWLRRTEVHVLPYGMIAVLDGYRLAAINEELAAIENEADPFADMPVDLVAALEAQEDEQTA